MSEETLRRKLARANAQVSVLETMIEDKTRELFVANEQIGAALDYQRQIYRIMPESLVVASADGTIKDVNESALTLLGAERDALVGSNLLAIWPEAAELLGPDAQDKSVAGVEHTWTGCDGSALPVLISVSRLDASGDGQNELVCIATDIRERKGMEIELRHAQKLQSVGQLAAGVAHEINTPMQFIGDNVHFLRDAFDDLITLIGTYGKIIDAVPDNAVSEALAEELEEAEETADVEYLQERAPKAFDRTLDGVKRVSSIVAAMKAFSHPQNDKAPTDLNKAVETTLEVAKNEYKYIADVVLELGELPAVVCHGGDINQVLLNLLVNAAHAIQDKKGDSDERGKIIVTSVREAESAVIAIEDTGCGIPLDVRDRIFDPFFTTKDVGRGTGQGLSLARSIVTDKHGGSLTFESELGHGTTFFLRLPLQTAATEPPMEATG